MLVECVLERRDRVVEVHVRPIELCDLEVRRHDVRDREGFVAREERVDGAFYRP